MEIVCGRMVTEIAISKRILVFTDFPLQIVAFLAVMDIFMSATFKYVVKMRVF